MFSIRLPQNSNRTFIFSGKVYRYNLPFVLLIVLIKISNTNFRF
ncbi:MAG: hypothetical protein AVDCRST_MAG74-2481 [uncultured Pyrinomonadaceae bacterium]|uniref:Uncharacterized protein n=1 Tax=uncultured Pyrinomonadaceae bacterium TaxID=2283094 RepID=A0A6J4PEL6_9BACT|nr:MAG: hypothetical protein AVDCRST_MAG74-2481 [uncultured Pyrinomonadaceae bacterium]